MDYHISHSDHESKHWAYENLALAAVVVLSVLTFSAVLYLGIWYYLRRRAQHFHRQQAQDNFLFGESTVSLAKDTSKALDEFLMTDVQPQRTSIIGRPGRSPSITMVFDDAYQDSPPHPYLTSHESSSLTLTMGNTLAPANTLASDMTLTSNNTLSPNITLSRDNTLSPVNTLTQTTSLDWRPSIPTSSMIVEASSTPRESTSLKTSTRSSEMGDPTLARNSGTPLDGNSMRSHRSQTTPQSPVSPLASRSSRASTHLSKSRKANRLSGTGQSQSGRLSSKMRTFKRASAAFSFEVADDLSLTTPALIDVSHDLDQLPSTPGHSSSSSTFQFPSPA